MKRLVAGLLLTVLGAGLVRLAAQGGPPPFVTFPILVHVAEDALDHGHFVFGEDVAVPAPLVHDNGVSTAGAATVSLAPVSAGLDVDVSNAVGSYEGETSAAANATWIVGGSNHIYPGACTASAQRGASGDCAPVAYVSNALSPVTWIRVPMSRVWAGTTFGIGFDPAVDVDKSGVFYYSYGVAPLSGSYPNAIVVMKSDNPQYPGNWVPTTPVTFNRNKAFDDKYYLAVDRSGSQYANRVYVSWDRNSGNNQTLYIASSADGGSSWTAPIKVNDGKTQFERVIGAYPAVDQNTGVVYDSWHDYAKSTIFVDKSTTGGATWGKDVSAATTHTGFGTDIGCVGGRAQGPAHALKVGPSGALYLAYADVVQNRGYDVLITKSIDGGASWSTPVHVNDDTGRADQFHPTLSVESNGAGGDRVTVTYYDRRDDPTNCAAHVYATQSTDGGAHWSVNTRLTTAASNFNGNPNGPGDYSSSTPWPSFGVLPFFSDRRTGDFEVFTGQVQ